MSEIYFKKERAKHKIGLSDVIFKFDKHSQNLEDCQNRFTQCDANGKEIKAKPKAKKKEGK